MKQRRSAGLYSDGLLTPYSCGRSQADERPLMVQLLKELSIAMMVAWSGAIEYPILARSVCCSSQ